VTFPLVKPALLGSSILTFALILENFTIPQILGSQVGIVTLPSRIWALMTSSPLRPNEATAVGMLLFALMAVLIYGQNRMLRGRSFVTGVGQGPQAEGHGPRALALAGVPARGPHRARVRGPAAPGAARSGAAQPAVHRLPRGPGRSGAARIREHARGPDEQRVSTGCATASCSAS
jgi:hypothetical protein